MTKPELHRAVAQATGERLATIRRLGFVLDEPAQEEPLIVDWDALDAERTAYLPQRGPRP